jgi:hypothetical protein
VVRNQRAHSQCCLKLKCMHSCMLPSPFP